MKIRDILASKGSKVVTIEPSDTIGALSRLLCEKRIGAAVVSSDGQTIDGVISERDVAYGLGVHGPDFHTLTVDGFMTTTVITCSPEDPIDRIASTMLSRKIRHLPVEEGRRLVGMVSIRDILNERVAELQQTTAALQGYLKKTSRTPEDRD